MDFLTLDPLLKAALAEDIGRGDITTDAILCGRSALAAAQARSIAREDLVLAGWPVFVRVFQLLGEIESRVCFREGQKIAAGAVIGSVQGGAGVLLKGERVALNLLQRMCGIASKTRRYADLIAHTPAKILDTRKTTPLWRTLDKYAVRVGGGQNHRFGLDDGILIKENHIAMAGGVAQAVEACRNANTHLHKIEVEVRNLAELEEALAAGADTVLLDNMGVDEVREAVRFSAGRCKLEVSGGINESNVVPYAEAGADFISVGNLTHSYQSSDISMLLEPFASASV